MKTTIEISDPLLEEARKVAAREGTTVRALVEQGVRRTLQERRRRGAFRLRKATFRGQGLQPASRTGAGSGFANSPMKAASLSLQKGARWAIP